MSSLPPPDFETLRINAAPTVYQCEPQWNWAPPPLADHDFWFVVSGQGTLEVDGRQHPLSAGRCFVLRPGDTPRGTQNLQQPLTVFFAHFDVLDETGNIGQPLDIPNIITLRDSAFMTAAVHRIERLWQRGDVFARHQAQLSLSALLWQVWDESRFPVSLSHEAFYALTTAIRREPGRRWTIDRMASEVCLSRAQFTRRFRSIFGTSPAKFVIQSRLERARQLLVETEMTLEQISAALGYTDIFFFARQFKQFSGQTPGTVRKRR